MQVRREPRIWEAAYKLWDVEHFRHAGSILGSHQKRPPMTGMDVSPAIRKHIAFHPGRGAASNLSVIGDRLSDTIGTDAIYSIQSKKVGDPAIAKGIEDLFRTARVERGHSIVPTVVVSISAKKNKSTTPMLGWAPLYEEDNAIPEHAFWKFDAFMNATPWIEIIRHQAQGSADFIELLIHFESDYFGFS